MNAKVAFMLTCAQASYLQLLQRAAGVAKVQAADVRVHQSCLQRGFVAGDSAEPTLTARGKLAVELIEGEPRG